MNIPSLRTFLAIIECGNLNKAAERLNVTQSTVTARLDSLEESLGQKVLMRSRKGAQLTRAGFIFRPYAETLVRSWEQGQSAVGLPQGVSGLFSFACERGLWDSAGRQFFDRVRADHPELAHEAWPGSLDEITQWLTNGLTDAAFTYEPILGHRLVTRPAARERIVLVSTLSDPAAQAGQDYVHVDLGPEFRRQHADTATSGHKAAVTYATTSWALDHLRREGGKAYAPWAAVAADLRAGRLFVVDGAPEYARSLHVTMREASLTLFPWLADVVGQAVDEAQIPET